MGIQSLSKRWDAQSLEGEPFIEKPAGGQFFQDDEQQLTPTATLHQQHSPRKPFHRRASILFHVGLVALYTGIFVVALRSLSAKYEHGVGLIYSPAREAVQYETREFQGNVHLATEYFGDPSEEKEARWNKLLHPTSIRIPPEDMARYGRLEEGIALPDGDYLGSLNAFHDLHCLRRLYRLIYPSYFFPNITAELDRENRIHAQHCLDRLRQGIQCHGDISPITYKWGVLQPIPLANFSAPHECVNWDALYDWAEERSVNVFEEGLLVHPTFGPAYAGLMESGRSGAVHDVIAM